GRRRESARAQPQSIETLSFDISDEQDVSEAEQQRRQHLHHAIALLNEVEKAIVMLYMEDRSYQEMEEILGINEGTIRVKMSRIKEKLRQLTKTNRYGA
ncbi:MAG TPA: sigma factor-like helix-turn-helix DNA-binding protein, partial [Chitinophagaceae bacterium]